MTAAEPTTIAASGPLVSIGLPVYNGAGHISKVLDHLLAQEYRHFEIIVSDNASTDDTAAIVRSYISKDSRIRLHVQKRNIGAVNNFRYVLKKATGKYFAWASDHDVHHRKWLVSLVQLMKRRPKAVLAYPYYEMLDREGNFLKHYTKYFSTAGDSPQERVRRVAYDMRLGGSKVYGLFLRSALNRVRIHSCAWWDRLLLCELSVFGEFVQVERSLWSRFHPNKTFEIPNPRVSTEHALVRQFGLIHSDSFPLYCRLPTLWHVVCMIRDFVLPPNGRISMKEIRLGLFATWHHFLAGRSHLMAEAAVAMRWILGQPLLKTESQLRMETQ